MDLWSSLHMKGPKETNPSVRYLSKAYRPIEATNSSLVPALIRFTYDRKDRRAMTVSAERYSLIQYGFISNRFWLDSH